MIILIYLRGQVSRFASKDNILLTIICTDNKRTEREMGVQSRNLARIQVWTNVQPDIISIIVLCVQEVMTHFV